VDQNQTYTSHPAHQVFLRQDVWNGNGALTTCTQANPPVPGGKVLDGDHCGDRRTVARRSVCACAVGDGPSSGRVLAATAVIVAAVFLLATTLGSEFLPQLDERVRWIRANSPAGIAVAKSAELAASIRQLVR